VLKICCPLAVQKRATLGGKRVIISHGKTREHQGLLSRRLSMYMNKEDVQGLSSTLEYLSSYIGEEGLSTKLTSRWPKTKMAGVVRRKLGLKH